MLTAALPAFAQTVEPIAVPTIETVVGRGSRGFSGDGGPATEAHVGDLGFVEADGAGNLYFVGWGNNRVRRVDAVTGIITTVAGTGAAASSGDGGLATAAEINAPFGLDLDSRGNLYISEYGGHRIRRVDAVTGVITTVAGTGTAASSGDGGLATAAQINTPVAVHSDPSGNVYIPEYNAHRVRRVDAVTGIITTYAGTGTQGSSGDGGLATAAQLTNPLGMDSDSQGNLYIADLTNRIRRVDAGTGIITTYAGTGTQGFSGDGGLATAAQISEPEGVIVDMQDNLYIAAYGSDTVRRVDAVTGIITTVAGTGAAGFSGDGGPAASAQLNQPWDVALDPLGNLYIIDSNNHRIRLVRRFAIAERQDESSRRCPRFGVGRSGMVFAIPQESRPTDVRAEATTPGLLAVTWCAAAGASSYLVQWRLADQAWSSERQAETAETRYRIDDLADGEYEVRVLAVVGGEASEPSTPARGEVALPETNAPVATGIADVAMDVGAAAWIDLAAAFEDPDDDPLRFAAAVDGDAATADVVSQRLRLRGARAGEATVTVTATDPDGLDATATFQVRVGVLLSLSGNAAAPEGGAIVLTATLSQALAEPLAVAWRIAPDADPTTPDADASDYESAGNATIEAGETTATIEFAIAEDDDIEPAREHLAVHLGEPRNPNVGLSRSASASAAIQEGVCDRTPAVRDELSANWRACHWPRPSDLAQINALDLSGRGIAALRPNDLLGLAGLEDLNLGGNALSALPDGLFAGLGRLREVSVADNPGAPFALAVELVRADADPWAPGPATVSARIAVGAPFALAAPLTVSPASAAEGLPAAVEVAAGETTSSEFAAAQVAGAPLTLRADAPPPPTAQCGGMPCFLGFETVPGSPLTLFLRPPRPLAPPAPNPLAGGDTLRLPLASLIAAGDAPDGLRWEASSSDESLASARIVGADLLVAPELASEGTAEITLTATDAFGLEATLRFQVRVEFHWPSGAVRGWRGTLHPAEDAAGQGPVEADQGPVEADQGRVEASQGQ